MILFSHFTMLDGGHINSTVNGCPVKGWKRIICRRKSGKTAGKLDVYYANLEGRRLRSTPDVARYLKINGLDLPLDLFNFKGSTKGKQKLAFTKVGRKDICTSEYFCKDPSDNHNVVSQGNTLSLSLQEIAKARCGVKLDGQQILPKWSKLVDNGTSTNNLICEHQTDPLLVNVSEQHVPVDSLFVAAEVSPCIPVMVAQEHNKYCRISEGQMSDVNTSETKQIDGGIMVSTVPTGLQNSMDDQCKTELDMNACPSFGTSVDTNISNICDTTVTSDVHVSAIVTSCCVKPDGTGLTSFSHMPVTTGGTAIDLNVGCSSAIPLNLPVSAGTSELSVLKDKSAIACTTMCSLKSDCTMCCSLHTDETSSSRIVASPNLNSSLRNRMCSPTYIIESDLHVRRSQSLVLNDVATKEGNAKTSFYFKTCLLDTQGFVNKRETSVIKMPPGLKRFYKLKYTPPRSPFNLIQEDLYEDPWRLLVATIFLNRTNGQNAIPTLWRFFYLFPNALATSKADPCEIAKIIQPLGLFRKRSKILVRFSTEYLQPAWLYPVELYGIGKYGNDSFRIFCLGEYQDVFPDDHKLNLYHNWLCERDRQNSISSM